MALYTSILTGGTNVHTTTSEEANYVATDFVSSGVIGSITNTNGVAPTTGAFATNAQGTPDMTVAVTAGSLYMSATPSGQGSQKFRVRLSANENVTISANSSGSTKYDWIYAKIDPTAAANPSLAGDDVASLVVSRSSSSTTDNGTPPTYGYNIAVVKVANGASTITNGTIADKRAQSQIAATDTSITTGWITNALPAVSSVTYNGNRSYDVVFASTVASILSPGMKVKGTKTVAGNGYMGGLFNGSSHYFTKTTPSGTLGTVTNNFTIEVVVQPTAYQVGWAACRADSTPNNGFGVQMNASGQICAIVWNAGTANNRVVTTYQSLPLNKKTHVAITWQGGTAYTIYFDGVAVPTATTTGGTAPTTAGIGGDFSIGRRGASAAEYFPGYISNVAVFDAVLTAATIKQHATYKLLGSETNCIGAWSLDNTANDQFGANNLTATGGVGYTAISPHGQMGDAVHTDQFCGLVMAVSTTTATIQVPEGITIPTSGGISSMAYSVQGNPFGWVGDKDIWSVGMQMLILSTRNTPAASTWYNDGGSLTIPVGKWNITYGGCVELSYTATASCAVNSTLSTATNSSGGADTIHGIISSTTASASLYGASSYYTINRSVTTPTIYYQNISSSGTPTAIYLNGTISPTLIRAVPSGL